ncbi:MAG: hypothetical protein M1837_001584 [Sclerophora amabilis]|nr:MAG: hypothetical protein M1837_001584 [Sclerophora amabilis]
MRVSLWGFIFAIEAAVVGSTSIPFDRPINARAPPGPMTDRYMIYPKIGTPKSQTDAFTKRISAKLGPNQIFMKSNSKLGVIFWVAPLTSDQVLEIDKISFIESVSLDQRLQSQQAVKWQTEPAPEETFDLTVKSGDLVKQIDATTDLKMISTPKYSFAENSLNYVFREPGGRGITIYIQDTGADPTSTEWINSPGLKRWIMSGDPFQEIYDDREDDPGDHGDCVFARAVGAKYGVAKNANVVIVKCPALLDAPDKTTTTQSSLLGGLVDILNDVQFNHLQKRAVVNLSYGFRPGSGRIERQFVARYKEVLEGILEEDVVVVVAAGNSWDPHRRHIDDWPAFFASELEGLIVVGAADMYGNLAEFSRGGPLMTVAAPGEDIVCGEIEDRFLERSGTSYATPAVSGLAAYLLSLDKYRDRLMVETEVAVRVKELIVSLAYSRVEGGPPIIHNGEESDTW